MPLNITAPNPQKPVTIIHIMCRVMFWSDPGSFQIERAAMDGTSRIVIVSTYSYGITIDYTSRKVYWGDFLNSQIEFSDYSGNGRTVLVDSSDGVIQPFSLTVYEDFLYWTDSATSAVYGANTTHNGTQLEGNVVVVHPGLSITPYGIEAVSSSRQQGKHIFS